MPLENEQSNLPDIKPVELDEALKSFRMTELKSLVYYDLNIDLDEIAERDPLPGVRLQIIRYAEENNLVIELIKAAYNKKPSNPKLQELVRRIDPRLIIEEGKKPLPPRVDDSTGARFKTRPEFFAILIVVLGCIVLIAYLALRPKEAAPTPFTTSDDNSIVTIPPTNAMLPTATWISPTLPNDTVSSPISPTNTPGQILLREGAMLLIPAGVFTMGSESGDEDEKPTHDVYLGDYFIDVYEVTVGQYRACVRENVCQPPLSSSSASRASYFDESRYDNFPVIYVSWEDAYTYCAWRDARLPTEAEWEKASRGGLSNQLYPWGNANPVCDQGAANGVNFGGCSFLDISTVGIFGANGYGLYDMAGNVWEWVADWYEKDYYQVSPTDNPSGPPLGEAKVLRGGRWSSTNDGLKVANRNYTYPSERTEYGGFRCAATP